METGSVLLRTFEIFLVVSTNPTVLEIPTISNGVFKLSANLM